MAFQPSMEPQILTLEAVLQSLFSTDGDLLLELPNNADIAQKSVASDNIVAGMRSPTLLETAHLRAAYYWLNLYRPDSYASRLEKLRGYLEAAHHLREIKAWEIVAQILSLRLDSGFLWQKIGEAGLFREQIEIYKPLVGKIDRECDRLCWEELGEAYIHLCQYPEAIAAWESLLQMGRQNSLVLIESRALDGLARCYGNWGKYGVALNYAQQGIACLNAAADNTTDINPQKARILATLSYISIHLRRYRQSIACGEEALAIARQIGDVETQWYALGRLAVAYGQRGRGQKALQSLEQQYQQRYQNQDLRQVSALLINLTLLCCYQRKFKSASQYVRESWEIHREIGNVNGQCYALLMSGFIELWQDNWDNATAYFQQSLNQAQLYGYKHHVAISLAQLSYIYSATGKLDLAEKLAKRGLAMARKTDNAFFTASSLAALGLTYCEKGKIGTGSLIIAKSLLKLPFWENSDGKLIVALVIKRLYLLWQRK